MASVTCMLAGQPNYSKCILFECVMSTILYKQKSLRYKNNSNNTVLALKLMMKSKKMSLRLSKRYSLYSIKQVWTVHKYTHQHPGQWCLECRLSCCWQCCSSPSHREIRCHRSWKWVGVPYCGWLGNHFQSQGWHEPPFIQDSFNDGRNILLGQVLLPAVFGRGRLAVPGVLSLLSWFRHYFNYFSSRLIWQHWWCGVFTLCFTWYCTCII